MTLLSTIHDGVPTSSEDSVLDMLTDEEYDYDISLINKMRRKRKTRKRKMVVLLAAMKAHDKVSVIGRSPNRKVTRHEAVRDMILSLKSTDPRFFTRMFRLTPASFDRLHTIISPSLAPKAPGGTNIISPMIQLCLALRLLAGGSYLDLALLYTKECCSSVCVSGN
jgi:hypothetical protein